MTPKDWAVYHDRLRCLNLLLSHEAGMNLKDNVRINGNLNAM